MDTTHGAEIYVRPFRAAGRGRDAAERGGTRRQVGGLWLGGPYAEAFEAALPGQRGGRFRSVPATLVRVDRPHERGVPGGEAEHQSADRLGDARARRRVLAPQDRGHLAGAGTRRRPRLVQDRLHHPTRVGSDRRLGAGLRGRGRARPTVGKLQSSRHVVGIEPIARIRRYASPLTNISGKQSRGILEIIINTWKITFTS